jgi:uncharacterized protein (DUF58 family)
MFRSRRIALSQEGWAYLVVLAFVVAGAILRDINVLTLLAGLMVGPIVLNWIVVAFALRDLHVTRRLPEAICAGDLLVVELALENRRRRRDAWAIVVEDSIRRQNCDSRKETVTVATLFAHVPRSESEHNSYRGRIMQRGRYRFGPLRVSTRFPLGLVRRRMTLRNSAALIVCPRLGRLTRRWHAIYLTSLSGSQRSARRWGAADGDFHALRKWRSGDSRRWIHWRTSARRGELMVREFESHSRQDLAILLDLWQPAVPDATARRAVELAVQLAATIVDDCLRRGDSRLLVAATGRAPFCLRGPASSALLSEVMENLAVAEAATDDSLPELVARTQRELPAAARMVVISTRATDLSNRERFNQPDVRAQAPAGLPVCIDTSDALLSEWFQPEPEESPVEALEF